MRKLIFLDFDGVLNSWEFVESGRNKTQSKSEYWKSGCIGFDEKAVAVLNQIVIMHDADIIISATMRDYQPFEDLCLALRERGLSKSPIGITPNYSCNKKYQDNHTIRGEEIRSCLKSGDHILIIDDSIDFGKLTPWLLRTYMERGLLPHYVEWSKDIFALVPDEIINNEL